MEVRKDEINDSDIIIASMKKRIEVHGDEMTRSSNPKSRNHGVSRNKHIYVKRKKGSEGPGPKKKKIDEKKEPSDEHKRGKKEIYVKRKKD